MLDPVQIQAQLTSAELAFVQAIADHQYNDGEIIIGDTATGTIRIATITAGSGVTITNGNGTIEISASGSSINFADEEVPSGSGTSFTLAHTPVTDSVHLYRGGARQQAGSGNDYTISGAAITLGTALATGEGTLADYRY